MKSKAALIAVIMMIVALVALRPFALAMDVTDLLDGQRVDWTRAGYPGAIPDITTNPVDVMNHGVRRDGVSDDSAAIQSAIDAAMAPAVVLLPAGVYLIQAPLSLKSGVVLRGEGHGVSVLACQSNSGCVRVQGSTAGSYVSVPGGASKGATRIQVADVSGFEVGRGGQILQDDIVAASASWGRDSVGQMVRITAINGNTLTIDPPLHLDFPPSGNPAIRPIRYIEQVGIEDLAIRRTDAGTAGTNNLDFRYAADCWVRRVESDWTQRYHLSAGESLHLEIRECYIHDARSRGSGGQGYGVSLARHVTSALVENNIFYDLRHSMIIQMGVNGCVFGYNYSEKNFSDDDGDWAKTHISLHGHYPFMNLFEGNVVAWAGVGDYWGPIGPGNTLFRNRIQGTDMHMGIGDRHGISVGYIHGPQNIIGNEVTGGSVYTSASQTHPDVTYADEWPKVLYHGNNEKGNVIWSSEMPDNVLPASFYRQSKPVFMGDLSWPAMGGDLTLGHGTIPAKVRFDSGDYIPKITGGDPDPDPSTNGGGGTGSSSGGGGCFLNALKGYGD